MIIRSYRRVYKIDRRLYKLDPSRLAGEGLNAFIPVGGISIRGVAYTVTLLVLSLLAVWFPPTGLVFTGLVPWWLIRHLAIPFLLAFLLLRWQPDGRPAELLLTALTRHAWERVRAIERPPAWEGKLRTRWDDSDVVLHRGGRIHGPAEVDFRVPVTEADRFDGWYAELDEDGEPHVIPVRADQTLRVRP